jgi:NadR type nicotinamide-nucleotide adenylyltransferase
MEKADAKTGGVIRIAITGPESTGKSLLSQQLAEHYLTDFVPEIARDYLNRLQRPYNYNDLLEIAQMQLKTENVMAALANKFLFCDTELIVIKIWSEIKYGKCHEWILDKLHTHYYPLYLLCDIDLPWEDDPLREHPDSREFLMQYYEKNLKQLNRPFIKIRGRGLQRLKNAIHAVESIL